MRNLRIELIRQEMARRSMRQVELAERSGLPPRRINSLLNQGSPSHLAHDEALALSRAFGPGVTPEMLMRAENDYWLAVARNREAARKEVLA